ncbi:MAG: hypothetical protein F6K40_34155, partial [Okeania sp. SIO3I5]|uniref:nSTAND1 domain-containing NTPase n=1 Tax=Okeania sp. SIO3I5 TaxID=2607805 RepID=UPI0013BA932B
MRIEALVVGINNHIYEKSLNLKAPVNDAKAISEILEKYGKFHVQRLPKDYDEQGKERFLLNGKVKSQDLETRISNLFNPMSKNEIPDVALFFFAGHGHVTTKGGIREGFLVTSDAQLKNEKYGISLNWFKELLKNSPVKKQIVWLDCCFSGELLNFEEADPGSGKEISRCFITASRSFETSMEKLDGTHGMFTSRLLKGLNPENSIDGWITNYILADYIKKNMLDTAQAPVFHNSGDAIILTTNTPTEPIDERWQNTPPYRALSYFTEQEKDGVFFHGRTRLTDELIDRIRTHNFIAVLGASGSGKSSLLRAGLLYQLKRGQKISGSDRWQYLNPFTPTATPLENLQQAIINPPKSPLERGTLKAASLEKATREDFEGSALNKAAQEDFEGSTLKQDSGGDNDNPPKSPLERGTLKAASLERETAEDFEGFPLTQERVGDNHNPPKSPLERGTLKAASLERETAEDFEGSPLKQDSGGDNHNPPKSPLERGTLKAASLERETAEDFEGSALIKDSGEDFEGSALTKGKIEDSPLTKGGGGGFKTVPHKLNNPDNIEGEKPENLTEKLIEFIQSVEAERVIMVIDQFEESFTLCETHEKRQEFFDCFLDAIENEAIQKKFCLILGMRADFLDQCSKYPGLATQIKEHQLLVTPLEKSEIEEAIKKPAELVGMGVEAGLVAQMTEDFLRNPGSLPLLQYTLDALWKYATQGEEKSKYLTLATYRKFGGIKGTLTKRANEVFESLNKSEKSVAKRIFLELVQPGHESINSDKVTDTRRRVILEDLPNELHSLELLLEVSDKLADQNNRLITKDKSEAGTLLDVIHEELIRSWEKLRNWVEEYQEALPLERKIEADAKEWKKQGEKDDWLWRERQLIKAEEYVTKYGDMGLLDGFACEFVRASQELRKRWEVEEEERKKRELEQEQKARRSTQRLNIFLSFFSVLMIGGAAYALVQQGIAQYKSNVSSADKFAIQAQRPRSEKLYNTSVLLGVESMERVKDAQKFLDSWLGKVLNKFLGGQLLDIPYNEADGAIRKGLPQLPDGLYDFLHQGKVLAVALSPDGKTIATASDDKTTQLWDVATQKPIATLNYKDIVKKVEFSPDGKTIVALSEDKTSRLWDAVTGKAKFTLQQQGINAVAFSPDSKTIATASEDKTAKVWDTATGKVKFTLEHEGIVNAVAFSPDGKNIGTVSDDNTAKVWDAVTGKLKNTIDHKEAWIEGTLNVVVFSPDGKKILTATKNTVYHSDIVSGIYQYGGNVEPIKDLVYSPDGEIFAVVGEDIVEIRNNKTTATLNPQGNINAVAFSPDSKIIATASDDNTIQLFDTATGNSMATLSHQGSVNAVAFSPQPNDKSSESHIILTASDDKTARLWQTAAGNGMITLKDSSYLLAFSPDGKTIANGSRIWDASTGKEVATFKHQSSGNTVAFSPDSKTIVTGGSNHTFGLWDATTGKLIANLRHQGQVDAVAFSPDGKTIATTSYDHTARLWDAATGKEIAILIHPHQVHAVAFSPDSQTIVTGSMDGNARLWNVATQKSIAILNHQDSVSPVAFSSNGKTIATAGGNTARLWDAATHKLIATLQHQDYVTAIALSKDGKTIATASNDQTARLWDAESGKAIATLNHQNSVNAVTLSKDGKTIATASNDQTARMWDIKGNAIATLNHQGAVYAVAFSPDGKTIVTGSNSGTYLHRVMTEDLMTEACRRLGRNLTAEEWQQYTNSSLDKYEKTCDELPVHLSLIAEAKNIAEKAEKEDIKTAISVLKKAQELSPEINLNPDAKTQETDPELVANKFAAPGKLEKGKIQAQEGNIEKAISIFKEAQKLEPEIDLDPDSETKETDPKVVANKFFTTGKLKEGKNWAQEGNIEKAISLYEQAQKLEPEIDLDPDTETQETDPQLVAKKFAASGAASRKVTKGKILAQQGKIEEAISLYDEAQKLAPDLEIDAYYWGQLCRYGSLNNQAQDVMF